MINNFEDMQKYSKEHMDLALQTAGNVTKGLQAIASELADFQKKSFEEGTAAVEKIMASKSLDKALEAQTDYVKTSYEAAMTKFTKIGEMYTDLAKDAYKPYEGLFGKAAK
ncbi:phasin family protein [Microvirga tunisiensis]|uniref:Phasin family protein n=2 Tax=Pannonibacter tanglangensis TaxID=2750084 RepID=A0A7X5F086_9HYPH|nr:MULTISPECIES: phasin family protein [unclassified Pannonibacter]NBN63743.1 phasin family protein [Pannonibacter sp. XCT-34]NBN77390.1 phasin family protein [Pannonibacter sp. XCT-53]